MIIEKIGLMHLKKQQVCDKNNKNHQEKQKKSTKLGYFYKNLNKNG